MANSQSLWFLENIDVLNMICPQKATAGMVHDVPHRNFKKGDYIFVPHAKADQMYFVENGRIKIGTYGDEDKVITKAILSTGEVFGELVLVGQTVRRDFAQALEDSTICVVDLPTMQSLMRERSDLNLFLMRLMGDRILHMEQRLESLIFKDSRTRIIEFLYQLAQTKGQRIGYETLVRKFLTHQEIANFTATSRQTVTTVLNDLRNRNLLTFNRKRMLVRDLQALGKEAGL